MRKLAPMIAVAVAINSEGFVDRRGLRRSQREARAPKITIHMPEPVVLKNSAIKVNRP